MAAAGPVVHLLSVQQKGRIEKDVTFTIRDTCPQLHPKILLIYHWPKLFFMTTSSCKREVKKRLCPRKQNNQRLSYGEGRENDY